MDAIVVSKEHHRYSSR